MDLSSLNVLTNGEELKFWKRYQEYYMNERTNDLPCVGYKKLKQMLEKCKRDHPQSHQSHHCSVCDETFFPSLRSEMSAIVGYFKERAQKLLQLHLSSGFRKYFIWFKSNIQGHHLAMIEEGKELVTYAMINAIAMRKILKKYDKIHYSKQGQAFKSQAQSMHIDIFQSPWLRELMAFHINLTESNTETKDLPRLVEDCSVTFQGGRPSLTFLLYDSVKLEIDLTCSICLDSVFSVVSLTCGHIFCNVCACAAASVAIVDELKAANPKAKCPLCREEGVFRGAVHLHELNNLLSRRCPDYWKERLQAEKEERDRQAKVLESKLKERLAREHWETTCRAFRNI
ncbi:hypothetical protein MKW92_013001 [Papaver armeniacum]|nr:hypothetical protein MKW92_013001 [Papaver armeniacum]